MRAIQAVATAAFLALGACATVPPPSPPVLAFDRADCGAVDLSQAISLTSPKERAVHHVTKTVDGSAACAILEGGASAYALFALPTDTGDKTLTVGAALEPQRILSPAVAVLDAEGRQTRRFRADEFMYRGLNYSVVLRPRETERFVVVSIDPSRVGQRYDSIVIGTNASSTYTPYGPVTIMTGADAAQSRVFSYEGAAFVTVNDSDTKEEGPPAG